MRSGDHWEPGAAPWVPAPGTKLGQGMERGLPWGLHAGKNGWDLTASGQHLIFNINVQINRKEDYNQNSGKLSLSPRTGKSSETRGLPRSMQGRGRGAPGKHPGPSEARRGGLEGLAQELCEFPSNEARVQSAWVTLENTLAGRPWGTLGLWPWSQGFTNLEVHR